ncbi:hypothetical protein BX070DRAFT_254501 [Coemansia spiralis]|nr:hypothetical protein BX070DRAFT_254501 [Coemansia spiralis]
MPTPPNQFLSPQLISTDSEPASTEYQFLEAWLASLPRSLGSPGYSPAPSIQPRDTQQFLSVQPFLSTRLFLDQSAPALIMTPESLRLPVDSLSVYSEQPFGMAPEQCPSKPASSNNNGEKRHRLTTAEKRQLYQWLVKHIDNPYPSETDRTKLNLNISKQKFKWWFSNHRHRSLRTTTVNGRKRFEPRLQFYKACLRLNVHIDWDIPQDIKAKLKSL